MPKFKEVTCERYHEMLGMLPPIWDSKGFLVGEASGHRVCRVTGNFTTTFMAFADFDEKFFESLDPLTVNEFKKMTRQDILLEVVYSETA